MAGQFKRNGRREEADEYEENHQLNGAVINGQLAGGVLPILLTIFHNDSVEPFGDKKETSTIGTIRKRNTR